jgi:hypothetical protein
MSYGPETPYAYIRNDPAALAVLLTHAPGVLDEPDAILQPYSLLGDLIGHGRAIGEDVPDLSPLWAELAALPEVRPQPVPQPPTPLATIADDSRSHSDPTPSARSEKWGVAELEFRGPTEGNPFVEVTLDATFTHAGESIRVGGFYDGDGVYRVRFLPPAEGTWTYETSSNATSLHAVSGTVEVAPPSTSNHGRVVVHDTHHFAYEDGTAYLPFGTTAYAWIHQSEGLQDQTLQTLAASPFTKLRMCLFPKSFIYNSREPELFPFERDADGEWDFTRPSLSYFRNLERRVVQLQQLGIEADLILFHPYDRWGFCDMPGWVDRFYTQYVVRRLGAYRNVWWSLANEYDFMKTKTIADWEGIADVITAEDHAHHLVSIHNGAVLYDNTRPWITHSSIQKNDVNRTSANIDAWRAQFGKPVVVDEIGYEGDLPWGWGNLSAQELVRRAWDGAVRGGYVNHGETYHDPHEIVWWSHGGSLRGESPARFAFLARVVSETSSGRFEPLVSDFDLNWGGDEGSRIGYFGLARPCVREFRLPVGTWDVDVIDTWAMTVSTLPEPAEGRVELALPGREYIAVRFRRRG